jgi:putative Mn2+ efflux pump MntP
MIIESISLSFALAMDAFAVSVSSGVKIEDVGKREIFRISWHFALFQMLFFGAGHYSGASLYKYLSGIGIYTASFILCCIGIHMFYEAFQKEEDKNYSDPSRGGRLILLSVATSIDAMAAGFGMSMLEAGVMFTSVCIFAVTFILCVIGTYSGDKISRASLVKNYSEAGGGIILILLSAKFLIS